jgi:predicted transposase YdaD
MRSSVSTQIEFANRIMNCVIKENLLEQRAEQAELQTKCAELQAQQERSIAQQAQQQAQQERSIADQAQQNLQAAASRLLGLGLGVEEVAATVGLSIEVVQQIT